MSRFVHHYTAHPESAAEGGGFDVIETDEGYAIWHHSHEWEADYESLDFACERADELAAIYDLNTNNGEYRGHHIEQRPVTGYFESYVGDRFQKADCIFGIRNIIDKHLDG